MKALLEKETASTTPEPQQALEKVQELFNEWADKRKIELCRPVFGQHQRVYNRAKADALESCKAVLKTFVKEVLKDE